MLVVDSVSKILLI